MNQAKLISRVFSISAIVLLCVMCSTVSYEYGKLLWAGRPLLTSAPAWVAFFNAIPFAVAIAICFVLYVVFKKKSKN